MNKLSWVSDVAFYYSLALALWKKSSLGRKSMWQYWRHEITCSTVRFTLRFATACRTGTARGPTFCASWIINRIQFCFRSVSRQFWLSLYRKCYWIVCLHQVLKIVWCLRACKMFMQIIGPRTQITFSWSCIAILALMWPLPNSQNQIMGFREVCYRRAILKLILEM